MTDVGFGGGGDSAQQLVWQARLDLSQAIAGLQQLETRLGQTGKTGEDHGKKVESAWKKVADALKTVWTHTEMVRGAMDKAGAAGVRAGAGAAALGAASTLEKGGGVMSGGLIGGAFGAAGGIPVAGAAVAAMGGVLAELEHLTNETATYSAAVLRNSNLLGLNTTQYQGLYYAAHQFGIEHEDLTRTIGRFQKNIEDGGKSLQQQGLTLKDVGITTTDTGTALNQFSAWLHNNKDAAQTNAAALSLLGRNGVALGEILKQGPQFLGDFTKALQAQGLVLDDNTLKMGAVAKAMHDRLGLELQSIKMQVTTGLEVAFTELWGVISNMAGNSEGLFHKMGQAIAYVVGMIAHLIGGAGAAKSAQKSMTDELSKQLQVLDGLKPKVDAQNAAQQTGVDTQKAMQQALEQLRYETTKQTEAIQIQTDSIREQSAAQVQAIQDVAAAQKTALQDTLKDQEEQVKMNDLLQQQADEQHQSRLSQLQDQLDMLKDTNDGRRRSGESLLDYERRLEEQKLTDEIKNEEAGRKAAKTQDEIRLENLRIYTDSAVKAITDKAKADEDAVKAAAKAEEDALNDRQRALQAHLRDVEHLNQLQTASLQSNLDQQTTASAASDADISKFYQSMLDGMKNDSHTTMDEIHDHIAKLFTDPSGEFSNAAHNLGTALGGALVQGVVTGIKDIPGAIWDALKGEITGGPADFPNSKGTSGGGNFFDWLGSHGASSFFPSRQHGGDLLRGVPYVLHGPQPEVGVFGASGQVVSHADAMQAIREGAGGGGQQWNAHFYGPVATDYVALAVLDRLQIDARRRRITVGHGLQ